jgi:DNA-binding transcriptional ArsR family regulator
VEEEFKVSKKILKTLTVDTRTNILKALEKRPMTASELSRKLGKHVTTISEHLQHLRDSELVERVERPGRKWVYYKLTKTGMNILHPKSYKFVFVFLVTFLTVLSGLFVLNVDAYPGEWLYGLDRAVEKLHMMLTFDRLERAKKHLQYAEERLEESKTITERGKLEYLERTIEDYEKEVNEARIEIERARLRKKNIIPVLEAFSESSFKHEAMLKNLATKAPQARKKIQPVLNITEKNRMNVIQELENLTGKPYSKPFIPG